MNQELRTLVDLRDRTLQKSRIAFGNRVNALERGADTGKSSEIFERWTSRFDNLEDEADKDIATLAKQEAIILEMVKVKGIGFLLAAKVVAMIDIDKASTVSALWQFAGYGMKNGERQKMTKGEKLSYNKRLKTTCYLVAGSFLKSNSPYREVYDSARAYYEVNRPDWTPNHQHLASMRKMVKIWLSHLWLVWRELEGLPTNEPYVIEKLGHEHIRTPEEFGWKLAQGSE